MTTNGGSGLGGRPTAIHWEGDVRNAPICRMTAQRTTHGECATREEEVDVVMG